MSRSYLQADECEKIGSHITKKVADKLEEIWKKTGPNLKKNGTI